MYVYVCMYNMYTYIHKYRVSVILATSFVYRTFKNKVIYVL